MKATALSVLLFCSAAFADEPALSPEVQERIRIAQVIQECKVSQAREEEHIKTEPLRLLGVGVAGVIVGAIGGVLIVGLVKK